MSDLQIVWTVLGFVAAVLFVEGLYLAWNAYRGPEAQRIDRRLRAISISGDAIAKAPILRHRVLSSVPLVQRLLLQLPRVHAMDRFLLQSGMDITVGTFLLVCLALAAAAFLGTATLGAQAWAGVVVALALVLAWIGVVQLARLRRLGRIDRQLPDALDLMARAMQAGHAFSSALRLVGTEATQPIAGEFQIVFDEINFGMPSEQALANLANRAASRDLRYFVVAVMIQRETGGNLAEILSNIAYLIRERQKLAGTIRVLSAEGRISAWILTILPFALAAILSIVNRRFISTLWTDPWGVRLVVLVLVLMLLGIWWMWRMVKFRI